MLTTPTLTDAQVKSFYDDGYLVVRGGFDAADTARIDAWAREVEAMPEVSGRHWVYHEKSLKQPDRQLVCRIENIAPFHDGFAALTDAYATLDYDVLGATGKLWPNPDPANDDGPVVLFGDGDFQMVELGDPANPVRLGEYRRKRDLASFTGLTVHGSRVGLYGVDGVEIVRLDGSGTRREIAFGRDTVGSVAGLAPAGGAWVAATNRGLLELDPASGAVKPLVPRPILGMDRSGEHLVFTDGTSLYIATLGHLQKGRVEAEMRLGRGFHPESVRVHGRTAVVMGARDAVWLDLRSPQKPRLLSRIGGNESGRILDAAVVGNRLFLLGPRGLQVIDRSGERVVDSVDVQARERMDVAGRHLVMIGAEHLQVVDATPFVASTPASPAR